VRNELTRDRLRGLMKEIAKRAPRRGGPFHVYLVGGGTAVLAGWREASIDADLFSEQKAVFRDIQEIKEHLNLNVEFVRPEYFVPPLPDTESRHVLLEQMGSVHYYHYDPYSQLLSKVVRGFTRDLADARAFVRCGMVDVERFRVLVAAIQPSAFARYPNLSPGGVRQAVEEFLSDLG